MNPRSETTTIAEELARLPPWLETLEDCVKLYNLDMGTGITFTILQRDALASVGRDQTRETRQPAPRRQRRLYERR